ncbi:MAG: P1 family peptidase [Syntrophobacteraceae bacterium]|jgi:L-aminopeptidase/D-esterase-like protein
MKNDTITAIEGVRVGHARLDGIPSGCTVILPDEGAEAGVDVRGGAPGTFGTDTLNPLNLVGKVNGIFFSGGSAFGLSAADGVRRYLKDRNVGFDSGHGLVPIVAGAIIFDLGINKTGVYPGADLAFEACGNASPAPVEEGSAGAGLGATVGKLFGFERCMKGGVGSSILHGGGGLKVGALIVVNAFGEVIDPDTGMKVAGARKSRESRELVDTVPALMKMTRFTGGFPGTQSTVIGAIATNALLNKVQLTKVAQMAHDGLARTVYPAHTQYDGDTIFALSCGTMEGVEVSLVGALAVIAAGEAILRAVRKAHGVGGVPAVSGVGTI